ncbi:MAG: hypothetical protein K6T17_08770 [Fimbriimonadales bacterium]|nr:hypothetical protein [Fimbriimonadales bacterium]
MIPLRIFWLVLWLGFLFVLLEVQHLHANLLSRSVAAWVPLIYCALALGLIPFRFAFKGIGRRFLVSFFLLGVVLGFYGVAVHTRLRVEPFMRLFGMKTPSEDLPRAEPLPPLTLSGLAALCLVALSLEERKNQGSSFAVVGMGKEAEQKVPPLSGN